MIKIDYNFRDTYSPQTSISNSLVTGTVPSTGTLIENKKFYNITDVIYTLETSQNVTFRNCLFYSCYKIFYCIEPFTNSVTFDKCTFSDCVYITDSTNFDLSIAFTSCIIYNTPYIVSSTGVTVTNCIYTPFFGSTVTYSGSKIVNPLFLTDFILMSKSRGYDYDSPAMLEQNAGWTKDAGCWNETRGIATESYDTIDIELICDGYKKSNILTGYKKYQNENGELIQVWNTGKEQKILSMTWSSNVLTESEMIQYLEMVKAKDCKIKFYPDSNNLSRYVEGILVKSESTDYSKERNMFFENDNETAGYYNIGFNNINVSILVVSEVGEWRF